MACEESIVQLMHKVLDEEASEEEEDELTEHLGSCKECSNLFHELQDADYYFENLTEEQPSAGFTDRVMNRLPSPKGSPALNTLQRHPLMTAVAVFVIMMSGYVYSLWQGTPFEAHVNGMGKLAYAGQNTVIVPKGETVKGDVIVKNGKVKIEGSVQGNVILINSQTMAASAGHVTGHIEEVNQIMSWIWYHIKSFVRHIFFIQITIHGDGYFYCHIQGIDDMVNLIYK